MTIKVGSFKRWWLVNTIVFAVLGVCCIGIYFLLDDTGIQQEWLICLLIIGGLLIYQITIQSGIIGETRQVECISTEKSCVFLEGNKTTEIKWRRIESIDYHPVGYQGRWIERMGYRLTIETTDGCYSLDSRYKEASEWEKTELYQLYRLLQSRIPGVHYMI